MTRILLSLFSIFYCVSCAGYMEIRLQSDFRQEATLTVSHGGGNETLIALPIGLQAGKERKLGAFPIEFADNYDLKIVGGRIEQLGISESSYTSHFEPVRGTLSPEHLHLPFNGLEIIFECDENWSGPKCDVACGKDCNLDRQNQTMALATDYSVDVTKLPEIVKRLKETTKVDNQLRKKEVVEQKEEENHEEKEETPKRKNDGSPKSLFSELFKSIIALKDNLARAKHIDQGPFTMNVKISESDSNEEYNEDNKTPEEETFDSKTDSGSPFDGLPIDPMTMVEAIIESRREKAADHSREIGKHSIAQKMLGMRHVKPPVTFNSMDGPGGGSLSLPFMGSLMKIMPMAMMGMMPPMPRIVRHTSAEQPLVPEGSGGADDFEFDQIIKTRSP